MSVHRIMGIESEFGILAPQNPSANPVVLSSRAVLGYGQEILPLRRQRMRWDYDVETPMRDARGFDMSRADADPSQFTDEDYGVANLILPNGARFYVDHAHPEYSSPEVTNPRDVALWDAAGDRIMADALRVASVLSGEELTGYKNNSDGKGASYGTHENYQVKRSTDFASLVRHLTPFFVTRCIYTGAGRVGLGQEGTTPGFQISSRADFFEAEVGLETTLRRPIINTRDEPHADPDQFRRLHVIVGDANMSQKMVFLKMGATALMLSMIEDGFPLPAFEILDPVASMHQVSHDIDLQQPLTLKDGRKVFAVDIQGAYLESASAYVAERGGVDVQTAEVLELWAYVLEGLTTDPSKLKTTVDWIAKRNLLDAYRERDGLHWSHPRLSAIDLQYADLRTDKGLAYILQASGGLDTMFTATQIHDAVSNPPSDTRAFFRGKCVSAFGEAVVAASWDSVIFDVGSDQDLVRITTPDARKATREMAAHLFDSKPILQFLEELESESQSAIK